MTVNRALAFGWTLFHKGSGWVAFFDEVHYVGPFKSKSELLANIPDPEPKTSTAEIWKRTRP